MISANDLKSRARSRAYTVGTAIAGPCRVFSMGVTAGTNQGGIQLFDATATSGTDFIQCNTIAGTSEGFKWEPAGLRFSTGLAVGTTGGAPVGFYVTYIEE